MFFSDEYKPGLYDITKDYRIKNVALLKMCEDTAGFHCDSLDDGNEKAMKAGKAWVIVGWVLKVIRRPKYGDIIKVTTWVKQINKIFCEREFEISDKFGICAIAASKWTMIDLDKRCFTWILPESINKYETEQKTLFDTPVKFTARIDKNYDHETAFTVLKKDTDIIGHMHNLNYYEYAFISLPEYKQTEYGNVKIIYKNEISAGTDFKCGFNERDNKNNVTIFNNGTVKAFIQMW